MIRVLRDLVLIDHAGNEALNKGLNASRLGKQEVVCQDVDLEIRFYQRPWCIAVVSSWQFVWAVVLKAVRPKVVSTPTRWLWGVIARGPRNRVRVQAKARSGFEV